MILPRFARAIPIYGCSSVRFTGALPPALGTSRGCGRSVTISMGQLLFSIAGERCWGRLEGMGGKGSGFQETDPVPVFAKGVCVIFNTILCRWSPLVFLGTGVGSPWSDVQKRSVLPAVESCAVIIARTVKKAIATSNRFGFILPVPIFPTHKTG